MMGRRSFMEQLAELLSDISPEEREEALDYYENYFDDAGPEKEAQVIREFGSPARAAAAIKENLQESGGCREYTGHGCEDSLVYQAAAEEDMTLAAKLSCESFQMEAYDGDGIRVEVTGTFAEDVSVRQENRRLEIRNTGKRRNSGSHGVWIYYPENLTFALADVSIGTGSVALEGALKTRKLKLETGTGDVTCGGGLQARECRITVGVGNVKLTGIDVRELECKSGVGNMNVTLPGEESDYNYNFKCGMGKMKVGGKKCGNFAAKRNIENGAGRNVSLKCGVGNMKVRFQGE